MADPFPPHDGREARIGIWISGAVHAALIGWLALGGALFRPQPAPAIRMSEVEMMSEAEFQALAAASRGAGPVGDRASAPPAQPRTPAEDVVAGGAEAVAPPAPDPDPQALPAPLQAREAAPNLSDVTRPQAPVEVATIAPAPRPPVEGEAAPAAPASVPPAARPLTPAAPAGAAEGATPAVATAPAPVLASSRAPFDVAGARLRRDERQAAEAEAMARAEAERQAAAAQAQAEAEAEAERQRQAQAEAAREAAERQAAAAAEARRRAAEAARAEAAEQARIAAEAAARERAETAAAEAAAREQAERAEAEARAREEAERQAALEAERAAAEAARRAEAARAAEERRLAEEAAREEAAREARRREQERRRAEEEAAAQAAAEALARAEAEAERARAEALAREQAETPRPAPADQDILSAALAEAMETPPEGAGAQGGGGRAPSGPPLSAGEKDSFRLAIAECWNIGALSREAQAVTVSVAFSLDPDGMPEADSIRLVSHEGGSDAAGQQAFEAARRAILRCALQQDGYRLPAQKYDRWRDVVVDFRPAGGLRMR